MMRNKNINTLLSPSNVLKAIIGVNIVMYLVSLALSGKGVNLSLNPFSALSPSTKALVFLGASGTFPIATFGNWWSVITANWLHGSLLHIIFNMLAIRTLAPLIMQEFGILRMFSIYTLSGAAGFLLSVFGNVSLTIGASAGICGLIGAAMYFGKSAGGPWGALVYKQTSGWVMMLILIGFLMPNINNWGHAGGFLSGIALAWIFKYLNQRRENPLDYILAISLGALTLWLLMTSVVKGILLAF
jgi:rhomboid protease GluP